MKKAGVTQLLEAHRAGDEQALDRAFELVYEELRRLASWQLRANQRGQTLNTTGLVSEAYIKLVDQKEADWENRGHFLGVASRAMRQIIVDYARRRLAGKRGAGRAKIPLDETQIAIEDHAESLLVVDEILTRLGEVNGRVVGVVECRYFAGLTEEETAQAMGTSVATVQRDWKKAKAWLSENMR